MAENSRMSIFAIRRTQHVDSGYAEPYDEAKHDLEEHWVLSGKEIEEVQQVNPVVVVKIGDSDIRELYCIGAKLCSGGDSG